jgi:hypothetical protein
MSHNEELEQLLLDLEKTDKETRTQLLADGSLFDGYAPQMERVHIENAERLKAVLEEHGWPTESMVGEDAVRAAWMVAQNAISRPEFQRRCLGLLHDAVRAGEAPPAFAAYLTDRIRFNQRRPQVYGTVFDWDKDGQLSPWQIEEAETVDIRRDQVGLPPLGAAIDIVRLEAQVEGSRPPASYEDRQQEIEEWARNVGWI